MKKPIFVAGNADWISELHFVIKKYNKTTHSSTKMTPFQTVKKTNEKEVYQILPDKRVEQKPENKLGQLVRTADNKRVFSKSDATNWSYEIYTNPEVIHNTIPSYQFDFLPGRYNENLLKSTNLTLDEKIKVMKEVIIT